jgi:sialate O-acetylesterase
MMLSKFMPEFHEAAGRTRGTLVFALACLLAFPLATQADVKLPAMFTDHAVLQRDMPVPVWGTADPGEEVTVSIVGDNRGHRQEQKATADAEGNWQVTLAPLAVGKPLTLIVEGKNRVEVKDILVGEVWLCSGQSNMEWSVSNCWNGDLDIAAANHPQIRLITVTGLGSQTPVEDFDGHWDVCSPETVKEFSAVGYLFARELQQQIGVPIGLIDNSWGGSACDAWICRDEFEGNPLYKELLDRWAKAESEWDEAKARADYEKALAEWQKKADAAKAAGEPEPPGRPWGFNNPMTGNQRPANLYHARLEPVMPFAIRGAIWYQGESNAGRAYQYREMFPLMVRSWREDWGQGEFPFYWVQLADFLPEKSEPGNSEWAELREAQTMAQDRLPNMGEAVIIDIGEAADIHPRNKLEVARRLARWALARDYGKGIVCQSPRYDSMEKQAGKIVIKFKNANGGLRTVDAQEVQGFAIAGADRKWVWAQARIIGPDTVEVSSEAVKEPVAVRYAWADNPVCNLYNTVGLPVTPFRTDDWPGVTVDAR